MKKISIVIGVLLLVGCASFQIAPDAKMVAIKSAARLAGHELAAQNPDYAIAIIAPAKTLLTFADAADKDKFVNDLFPSAVKLLLADVDDPVMRATLSDVLMLIKIDVPEVSLDIKSAQIKCAMEGFIEGMELVELTR